MLRQRAHACDMAGFHVDKEAIIPLLQLPALQQLGLWLNVPKAKRWLVKKRAKSLTNLALWESNVVASDVRTFLRFAPNLRCFSYSFLRDYNNFWENERVDFAKVGSALKRVSATLSALTIEIQWISTLAGYKANLSRVRISHLGPTPLGSLQSFGALKYIQLPFEVLVGPAPYRPNILVKILPPSLECLYFKDEMVIWNGVIHLNSHHSLQDIITVLADYLRNRHNHAPALREVDIDLHDGVRYSGSCWFGHKWGIDEEYPPEAMQMRRLAAASRVRLTVVFDYVAEASLQTRTVRFVGQTHPEEEP
ncbi:hypothetical protein BJY01DRAFT_253707 [Aspergillus pseudoustus]|uniref:F-box domain-containing protein n=1 Tax=Aspergillus pseudoustus TaxID=1810923 RepID=A0ABR4IYC8_9EURO